MVSVIRSNSKNKDFIDLIKKLDKELNERYGIIQSDYNHFNLINDLCTVVIAYIEDVPVGCGCFKEYDNKTIEIKRMFIKPKNRGKGISKTILKELEKWALELGFSKSILETGIKQPEAIRLYEKNGYFKIDNYGQYVGVSNSICFEKILKNEKQ